jgi:hypothetical protein
MANADHGDKQDMPVSSTDPLAPGDEAAPGTPGTGEVLCPTCHGTGIANGGQCQTCGGSGRVVKGIGGA